MKNLDILKEGLQQINIAATEEAISTLVEFKNIMLEWNEKINLTAITDEEDVYIKHFLDSATCIDTGYIKENSKVVDVGTGAGFPGIPIKILRNDIEITLLDSLNKRISYLNDVIKRLSLSSVEAIHFRAEEAGSSKMYRERYDVALSRAVAPINSLCEYCLPFVKVGGVFICQKGPSYEDELKDASNAIKVLGGNVEEVKKYKLPFSDINHYIIIIRKITNTPPKYPRKPGKPTANPIS